MTIQEFDRKYGRMGGVKKLAEMRDDLCTHSAIAKHFGVSRAMIRLWMRDLFKIIYDPRPDRAEERIAKMVDFAKKNPVEEFRAMFRRSDYYKKAMAKCIELGIYADNNINRHDSQ